MAATTSTMLRTHRFALSISGGVALGSYEAGVLAQLYRDLFHFNAHLDIRGKARVTIDAIAGASAGSITGLILAQSIALGRTPDQLESRLRACWIDLLEIKHLLAPSPDNDGGDSIFTGGVVEEIVGAALDLSPEPPTETHEPIAYWATMTNLDGVPYVIDFERQDEHHAQASTELYALDYRDYIPFLITGNKIEMVEKRMIVDPETAKGEIPDIWQAAVEAARASSAFPIAFPSRYQHRDLTHYPHYIGFRNAVETGRLAAKSREPALQGHDLPDDAWFQFVDGGLFNNEPIGKCIDAVECLNQLDTTRDPNRPQSQGKVGRSFVIIEPDPQLPDDVECALKVSTSHPTHPTLPPAVLGKILSAYFNSALYGDFQTAAKTNRQLLDLDKALGKLDALGLPATELQDLKTNIKAAVGLDGKVPVTLHRIPHQLPTMKRLAGAFGGHFGGFLRKDFREADFITGRHEARLWFAEWLRRWLQDHAEDIDRQKDSIDTTYVASLLGPQPPSPETTPIEPTGLTPIQLADSGWFPHPDDKGMISAVARNAALSEDERRQILQMAEDRGETLLEAWTHLSRFIVHPAAYILEHLFNNRFVKDPHPETRNM